MPDSQRDNPNASADEHRRIAHLKIPESPGSTPRCGSAPGSLIFVSSGSRRRPATSLPDFGKLQQRYVEFASSEGTAAYRKLSQLSADYYAALLNTGMNLSEEFYRQVYQTKPTPPAPAPAPGRPARELVFTGPIGSTASRAFVVSNRTNQPAKVSFELSEFVKENGSEKLRLDAQINPSSFDLAGHAERTIDCSLPLTEALEAGCEYRALLRVIGFPGMKIGLLVKAESASRGQSKASRGDRPAAQETQGLTRGSSGPACSHDAILPRSRLHLLVNGGARHGEEVVDHGVGVAKCLCPCCRDLVA